MTPLDFATYLRGFDDAARSEMKIRTSELLELYASSRAQLIDNRFADEAHAWRIGMGIQIPLNALPDRLGEPDPAKTIVTMCPHYDRAEMARRYLTMQGYVARYLTDGMLGLADFLRGDRVRDDVARLGQPE